MKLVWPLALGMVNNAVMQFVDRVFLARDSLSSIEAVLPACTLAWVFMGFFQSVVGYSGVFVSQYFGAGNEEKCGESYRAGLVIALGSGLFSLALVPLGGWIFSLTAPSPAIVAKESVYFDAIVFGSVFLYAQMAAISYFTGHGRTRIVFWVNLVGNLLNIALDPLLIFGLDLDIPCFSSTFSLHLPAFGIAGAAYATVFSQFVQFVILFVASRRAIAQLSTSTFDLSLILRILRYGIPAGGYEVLNMLSFTIFVFVTGTLGDLEFAVSNACFTINYLIFAPMIGFGIGAQTLVGQAIGRGEIAAAVSDFHKTMTLGLGFVFAACVGVLVFSRPILLLFVPDGVSLSSFCGLGFCLLTIMSAWLLFDALDVIVSGALKGAGDTRFVFVWMFISSFVIWMPLVFVVKRFGGDIVDLWLTMVFYVVIISIGSFIRWRLGGWKRIRIR